MQLKFFAKGDLLVTVPGAAPSIGQSLPRVGRDATGEPTKEPFVCDSESDAGRRLMKLVRREACLTPADEATADACGVAFEKPKSVAKEQV